MNSSERHQSSDLAQAFAHCRKIALGHYENFPVGSLLLPKTIRPHFYSLYAFMRTADDFADLPGRPSEEKVRLLEEWRARLRQCFDGSTTSSDPVFLALRSTIETFGLQPEPLHALLDAFEFDASQPVRFETFEDLHWYTSRSAEPVGQLVLALFGYRDSERIDRSNAICTALQVLNFIQDIREDIASGRDYFPMADKRELGLDGFVGDLSANDRSKLLELSIRRIEDLFRFGTELPEMVEGRLRYELRAVLLGAKMLIERIKSSGFDTFEKRPKLSKLDSLVTLISSIRKPVRW